VISQQQVEATIAAVFRSCCGVRRAAGCCQPRPERPHTAGARQQLQPVAAPATHGPLQLFAPAHGGRQACTAGRLQAAVAGEHTAPG